MDLKLTIHKIQINMENNSKEKEDSYEPMPSLNGQNMDRTHSREPYLDEQIESDRKHEESKENNEHSDWPFAILHQQITDVPPGAKDDTDIKDNRKEENQTSDDRAK